MIFKIIGDNGGVVKTITVNEHDINDPLGQKPKDTTRTIEADTCSFSGLDLVQVAGRGTNEITIDRWPAHRERG